MRSGHRLVPLAWCLAMLMLVALTPNAMASGDDDALAYAKSLSRAFRQAAESARPAVVTIISTYDLETNERYRQLRQMPGIPNLGDMFPDENVNNVGSGVVTDPSGIILTNNHVVEDADAVLVRLPDGTELEAKDIRTDPMSDLAVLKVEPTASLAAAKLGDSDGLEIGDWVIAIGSPFELEATVSAGIISGKERKIQRIQRGRLLQTDAAINPGNSGGPLISLDGEVIGLNTAIASSSGGYQGVGFAIPINRAKWISRELLRHGKVRRAYLGIHIGELDAKTAGRFDLAARSGALVADVIPDSPADDAGLRAQDVIVDFSGTPVRAPGDLQEAVEQKEIGSTQPVSVIRRGDRITLDVKMTALPDIDN